jgi:hypothetical protein
MKIKIVSTSCKDTIDMDSTGWLVALERFLRNAWELKPVVDAVSWKGEKSNFQSYHYRQYK